MKILRYIDYTLCFIIICIGIDEVYYINKVVQSRKRTTINYQRPYKFEIDETEIILYGYHSSIIFYIKDWTFISLFPKIIYAKTSDLHLLKPILYKHNIIYKTLS